MGTAAFNSDIQLAADCRHWEDDYPYRQEEQKELDVAAKLSIQDVKQRPTQTEIYSKDESNAHMAASMLEGCTEHIAQKLMKVLSASNLDEAKEVFRYIGEMWSEYRDEHIL